MKFSLNPITAQKMAGLQKIVRRLIIIFLSPFFLVIIKALLLSSFGKNLTKPYYYEPKDAMRNLQEIFTRLRVFVLTLFFGAFHNNQILELLR